LMLVPDTRGVCTYTSPDPTRELPPTVLMLVPDTNGN
jgi:hypothetical protein